MKLDVPFVRLAAATMYCDGVSPPDIAKWLGISEFKVKSAILRLLNDGLVCDKPRSGRPTKLDKRGHRAIKYYLARNTVFSISDTARKFSVDRGVVRRVMHASGFRGYSDRNEQLVTRRWLMKRRQLYIRCKKVNFANVVFTDEKTFASVSDGRLKIIARSRQEYLNKHGNVGYDVRMSVRVWGAVTSHGVGPLIFFEQPASAECYIDEVLSKTIATPKGIKSLFPQLRRTPQYWLFQQDNDPTHKAKITQMYLRQHHVRVLKWPPRSPDLSPIENVWSMIVYRLRQRQLLRGVRWSRQTLKQAIQDEWNAITPEECKRLCLSVDKRLEDIRNNNWHATSK